MTHVLEPPAGSGQATAAATEGLGVAFARVVHAVTVLVLVLGGALRLRQYFADRALWLDELQLSANIIHRSYRGLLHPLSSHQGAPVGWLWAEKAAIGIFGNHELALRLVPCVLSVAALGLFYLLTRRWLGGLAQLVACTLFAFSPDLINYAAQVKQYGTDVFFVIVVLLLSTMVDDAPTRRRIALWATLSIVAMWCSHAASIALAACSLVLLARTASRARKERGARRTLRWVIAASLVFAVSFALEYIANLRAISEDRGLVSYWRRGSPPMPYTFTGDVAWLWHALPFLMTNPFGFARPGLATILVIAGAVLLVVRRASGALIVIAPIIAAIVLSLAGKYPLHERLALYLAPCLFISVAALADLRGRGGRGRLAGVAIVGLVAVVLVGSQPVARAASVAWRPTDITDSRGPFAFVASHWRPGDALYVDNPWAEAAYGYYGARYRLHAAGTFDIRTNRCLVDALGRGVYPHRRVWFVMTHLGPNEPRDRVRAYRSYFAAVGTPLASYSGAGQAAAFLYDVGHVPPPVAGAPTRVHGGCVSIAPFHAASQRSVRR